jgi:hypothetical protein
VKGKKRDPAFIKAEIAMKRAAQKAREKTRRIGSGVIVLKDGQLVAFATGRQFQYPHNPILVSYVARGYCCCENVNLTC